MDDLHKDIYHIWELRLKLERTKKKSKYIIAALESEEYRSTHTREEYLKARREIEALISEQQEVEADQIKLEEKIKLPNPFLKTS